MDDPGGPPGQADRPAESPHARSFPIAFYVGALGLDFFSRVGRHPAATVAATWLIVAALAGFVAAAVTGLAERATMRAGSKIRGLAARHTFMQFAAAAVFVVNLAIRWSHRGDVHSDFLWIALDVIGVLTMTVGADIGGDMVFRIGYRGLGGE